VHCVVTSPPYWGLRDYGVGGAARPRAHARGIPSSTTWSRVFREMRRVLRSDGTAWVNMGDSYARTGRVRLAWQEWRARRPTLYSGHVHTEPHARPSRDTRRTKDSSRRTWSACRGCSPSRYAPMAGGFARTSSGASRTRCPRASSDRCTKAHEYLFLLTRSRALLLRRRGDPRAALAEHESARSASSWKTPDGWDTSKGTGGHGSFHREGRENGQTGYHEKFGRSGTGIKNNASFHAAMVAPGRRKSGNKERKPASARGVPIDTGGNSSSGAVAGSVPWEGFER
jgi:hypothetical protein